MYAIFQVVSVGSDNQEFSRIVEHAVRSQSRRAGLAIISACLAAITIFHVSGEEPARAEPLGGIRGLAVSEEAFSGSSIGAEQLPQSAPAAPFSISALGGASGHQAAECLADAIYYEAGSEGEEGQRAVAQVVLNRVRHPMFPASVCGVVYQGASRSTGCQFTFTCDGSLARTPSRIGWSKAAAVARRALAGDVYSPVGHATHYHAAWMVPYWASSVAKIGQVGQHVFYVWKGQAGMPASFSQTYSGMEDYSPPIRQARHAVENQGNVGMSIPGGPLDNGSPVDLLADPDNADLLEYRRASVDGKITSSYEGQLTEKIQSALQ